MTLLPLERRPALREQVYDRLRGALRRGAVGPGDRLTEAGLASGLGVSRTPVREALGQLAREGLIVPLPKGGFGVPALDSRDLAEVFEVRALLEPHAVARAAEMATPAGLQPLEAALSAEAAHLEDANPEAFSAANHEFRVALFALCGNQRLARTVEMYDDHVQFVRLMTLADRPVRQAVIDGQTEMLAALRARDSEAAGAAMVAHLARAQTFLEQALAAAQQESGAQGREPEADRPPDRSAGGGGI